LPSYQLARRLVQAYLNHEYICYPMLHPASLVGILERAYNRHSHEGNTASGRTSTGVSCACHDSSPFESFILNMILAIATTHITEFDWQILPSAENHHDRALSSVAAVLQVGGLQSLQAILLLAQYRMSSSMHDNSASKICHVTH
jgi:hypothetical protein